MQNPFFLSPTFKEFSMTAGIRVYLNILSYGQCIYNSTSQSDRNSLLNASMYRIERKYDVCIAMYSWSCLHACMAMHVYVCMHSYVLMTTYVSLSICTSVIMSLCIYLGMHRCVHVRSYLNNVYRTSAILCRYRKRSNHCLIFYSFSFGQIILPYITT